MIGTYRKAKGVKVEAGLMKTPVVNGSGINWWLYP